MNKSIVRLFAFVLLLPALGLLGGCGGPAQATATAIPASVVRPVQPTPEYATSVDAFMLLTPEAAPEFAPTTAADRALEIESTGSSERAAIQLYMRNQTPSAVGIAPGGAAIYAERGGRAVASVPVGGVLTVTGKSEDGAWYAVYNEDAAYGWTPAGQLRVYGGDDLVVVEEAPDPAPIATLLARAAEPVRVLDDLMAQMEVTSMPPAAQPTATLQPTPEPPDEPASTAAPLVPVLAAPTEARAQGSDAENNISSTSADSAKSGTVISEGRLNLRTQPETTAAIVRKLDPGDVVTILDRSPDGGWLQVQLADGATGWVAVEFIAEP